MSAEEILAQAEKVLSKAGTALEGPLRTIADLLLENSQLLQSMSEELLADRQINSRKIEDAVRLIEKAAKEMETVAKAFIDVAKNAESAAKNSANASRNSYDAYTSAEALRGQLEGPLRDATAAAQAALTASTDAAEAAEQGSQAAEKGAHAAAQAAEHGAKTSSDITRQFETFKAEVLAKRAEEGKSEKLEAYAIALKAFNNLPLSTRILSTIILSLLIVAFIMHTVEKLVE